MREAKDLQILHGAHEDQIQEGKRKPSEWCVCGTPGARRSAQRGERRQVS